MSSDKRMQSWIDAVLKGRRPKHWSASRDEIAMMQTAAELHSAKPGADLPDPAFVERLAQEMRAAEMQGVNGGAVTRRRFVGEGIAVAAAVVAGIGLDEVLHTTAAAAQETLQPVNGKWTEVAKLADLSTKPTRFSTNGVTGYLLKSGNEVQAISASCTHLGVCVQFDSAGTNYWCPCRNARFNLDGSVVKSGYQAPKPLAVIQSRINGDAFEVLVPY